jgi:hypothetical protein
MNRIRDRLVRLIALDMARPRVTAERFRAEQRALRNATDGELVAMADRIVNRAVEVSWASATRRQGGVVRNADDKKARRIAAGW